MACAVRADGSGRRSEFGVRISLTPGLSVRVTGEGTEMPAGAHRRPTEAVWMPQGKLLHVIGRNAPTETAGLLYHILPMSARIRSKDKTDGEKHGSL